MRCTAAEWIKLAQMDLPHCLWARKQQGFWLALLFVTLECWRCIFLAESILCLLTCMNEKALLCLNLIFLTTFFIGLGFWSQNKLHATDRSCEQRRRPSLSKLGTVQRHDDREDNCGRRGWAPCIFVPPVPHGGVGSYPSWEYHWDRSSSRPRFFQQPCEVRAHCSPLL